MLGVTVDSGARERVLPAGLCPGIALIDNDLLRNGVEYEVVNGEPIANIGERRCDVMTVGRMAPKRRARRAPSPRCLRTNGNIDCRWGSLAADVEPHVPDKLREDVDCVHIVAKL